jgi:hypothetical protein
VVPVLSGIVEIASFAAFVAAGWLVSPVVGLAVLGAALWLIAQALEGVTVKAPRVKFPRIRVKLPRIPTPKAARPGRET